MKIFNCVEAIKLIIPFIKSKHVLLYTIINKILSVFSDFWQNRLRVDNFHDLGGAVTHPNFFSIQIHVMMTQLLT